MRLARLFQMITLLDKVNFLCLKDLKNKILFTFLLNFDFDMSYYTLKEMPCYI